MFSFTIDLIRESKEIHKLQIQFSPPDKKGYQE